MVTEKSSTMIYSENPPTFTTQNTPALGQKQLQK